MRAVAVLRIKLNVGTDEMVSDTISTVCGWKIKGKNRKDFLFD
jgi:hypothetical protein